MSRRADLLLLNGSNYAGQPIYPYAFVQVSAIARQRGLRVERYDLLGASKSGWTDLIGHLVETHRPRMVGFHVRQADSQYIDEYRATGSRPTPVDSYFPVHDTKILIDITRRLTDVPIVVGGFGFTLHAQRMFEFLQPDYGVAGAPDTFFDSFEALAARDTASASSIHNLMFLDAAGYQSGPQAHLPPLAAPEYDEAIFAELCAFYAKHGRKLSIGRVGEVDVPVEVARGCPCKCYFCTEPFVKGKRVQRRNIDAVMADVEFLVSRDVRSVWFICSEINMGGMDFALQIAERMRRLNARLGSRRVLWKAYAMPAPGMSRSDLETMMSAGYVPGWNEFASFDDGNLRACGMPYRMSHAVRYLKDVLELSRDQEQYHGPPLTKLELFLGNAFMTAGAMRTTLAVVDREQFSLASDHGAATMATRVYEIDGNLSCGTPDDTTTFGPLGYADRFDPLQPTFHYSRDLVELLGSANEVDGFLEFVGQTFLSRGFRRTLNVPLFLTSNASPALLAMHLAKRTVLGLIITMHIRDKRNRLEIESERQGLGAMADAVAEDLWRNPTADSVLSLYASAPLPPRVRSLAMSTVLHVLFGLNGASFQSVFDYLGLADEESRETPYRLMKRLYARFDSTEEVIEAVRDRFDLGDDSLDLLQLKHLLLVNNVRILPSYRSLLFGSNSVA